MSQGVTDQNVKRKNQAAFWTKWYVVFLAALFCCVLWGSAPASIKMGYRIFLIGESETASKILFAGVRFTIAGLMVIAAGSVMQRHFLLPNRTSIGPVLVLMMLQTVLQYVFLYIGYSHTSGVRGSIITAAGTFFSIGLSCFVFRFEKLTANKVLGSILGFAGVILVVTAGAQESGGGVSFFGEGFMTLSALSSALAGCFIKLFSKKADPVLLSGWQFFFGGLFMTAAGLLAGGHLTFTTAACTPLLIYLGFISAGAYTVWGILLKYNDVSRITILGFMNPLTGVILSALILHEQSEALSLTGLLALVLVCTGIWTANRRSAV